MPNKKRDRNGYRKQLGRYSLNRANIITIEKIMRSYADEREMRYSDIKTLPEGRKHMPRKYADRHIQIGRYRPFHIRIGWGEYEIHYPGVDYIYDADSVKFLPKFIKKSHYVEVACRPGIAATFTPLTTTIYAQTHYATGNELRIMKEVVSKIERYLLESKKSFINTIKLDT